LRVERNDCRCPKMSGIPLSGRNKILLGRGFLFRAKAFGGIFLHGDELTDRLLDASIELVEPPQDFVLATLQFQERIGRVGNR
jgi:hypothetical protein